MIRDTLLALALPLFFGMVLVWFFLIRDLFKRLEQHHPAKYEAMGRPTLFLRNNIGTGLATMKFLFRREHSELNDPKLSKLSDFMLGFFIVYTVLFLGICFGIPAQPAGTPP